jgi:RNA polymerase sigma-70 factor, ECF subfamily
MDEVSSQAETLQLIHRCREGDTVAVESLVHAYKTLVYRLALSILDEESEADEAAQDALLTAIRKLDSFRGEAAFSTWLYAITLNVCRMRLRKRRSRERWQGVFQSLFVRPGETVRQPEQAALENENEQAVWQAIHRLPIEQREVIVLRYMHELRIKELAQVVGVSERTVRSRLQAAQTRLQELLAGKLEWS